MGVRAGGATVGLLPHPQPSPARGKGSKSQGGEGKIEKAYTRSCGRLPPVVRPVAQLRQGRRAIDAFPTLQGRQTPVALLAELGKLRGADFLMLLQES